jgi:nucleoside-diphosphate-sugar epimerase
LTGSEIRIHGDGNARRSYLYGSDAAWWTLAALVNGRDVVCYNLGSPTAMTHLELVKLICEFTTKKTHVALNKAPNSKSNYDELFPDITLAKNSLGVHQTCSLAQTVDKTWRWFNAEQ